MVKDFTLINAADYRDAVDWIRSNVVLRNNVPGPLLQLNLAFPKTHVTVFVEPPSHYVLAFRGSNGIYLFDDPHSIPFEVALKKHIQGANTTILKGFNGSHNLGGLETFVGTGPVRNRTFVLTDVYSLSQIPQYAGGDYAPLRKPLSLLVCMLAEGARFPVIQHEFARMYQYAGHQVAADEIVQSYRKAKVLRRTAFHLFPGYRVPDAITKVKNRATELGDLLRRFQTLSPGSDPRTLILAVLGGKKQPWEAAASVETPRAKQLCGDLALSTPDQVTKLLTLCKDPVVVRAAQETVALPGIDD